MQNLECSEALPVKSVQQSDKQQRKPKDPLAFNMLQLLREPQAYIQKIHELNERGVEKIRQQGEEACEEAVKLLGKAEEMISVGRNVCKSMDSDIKICVAYNLACAYQGLWVLQKCKKSCEQATEEIETVLRELDSDAKELRVKLSLFLLKLKLQHCAILSQLGHHQKALDTSKQGLRILRESLQLILEFANTLLKSNSQPSTSQKVAFAANAQKSIMLLQSLIESLGEDILANRNKKPILYFWKYNPENNERLLKMEFANKRIFSKDEEVRSPLGLQNKNDWIEEFNIGTIMHMSAMSYGDFHWVPSFFQELTKKALYEKVIYCSVNHFTIATEIRFIEDPNRNKDTTNKKFPAQPRSQAFKVSELYHLKAIEIVCKGISTCSPYLNHLIATYYKHYLQSLNAIEEHENSLMEDRSSRKNSIQSGAPNQYEANIQPKVVNPHDEYYKQTKEHGSQPQLSFRPESEFTSQASLQPPLLPQSQYASLTDRAFEDEDDPLKPVPTEFRKSKKKRSSKQHKESAKRLSRISQKSQKSQKSDSNVKTASKISATKERSGSKKKEAGTKSTIKHARSPQNINLVKRQSKSKSKIPLSIIKRAFQDRGFKDMSPSQVLLTQKTSTQINVVLKKHK